MFQLISITICILFGILNLVIALLNKDTHPYLRLLNAFASGWCFAFAIAMSR